jgi:sigma-E factor negative regulatory protein RseC
MKPDANEVINHEGVVTRNSGGSVIVSISTKSACSGCHAKSSCSTFGTEEKLVEVKGNYNVNPGDNVNVMMSQSMGYTALTFGYVLPFVILMSMLITMIVFKMPELTAGLISISALIPYYLVLYCFRERLNNKFEFTLKA